MTSDVVIVGQEAGAVADSLASIMQALDNMNAASAVIDEIGLEFDNLPVKPRWRHFLQDKLHHAMRSSGADKFTRIRAIREELDKLA